MSMNRSTIEPRVAARGARRISWYQAMCGVSC